MSMRSDFVALALPLFADRVYAQGTAPPYAGTYLTYSRINANEQSTLDQNGGVGNLINTRMQADVYSLNYSDAQAKATALKAALKGWSTTNLLLDEQDMYEPDTKLHRVMLDLSIWHY